MFLIQYSPVSSQQLPSFGFALFQFLEGNQGAFSQIRQRSPPGQDVAWHTFPRYLWKGTLLYSGRESLTKRTVARRVPKCPFPQRFSIVFPRQMQSQAHTHTHTCHHFLLVFQESAEDRIAFHVRGSARLASDTNMDDGRPSTKPLVVNVISQDHPGLGTTQ